MSHHRDLTNAKNRVIDTAIAWRKVRQKLMMLPTESPERRSMNDDIYQAAMRLDWAIDALIPFLSQQDGEAAASSRHTSIATAKTRLSEATTWRGQVQRTVWKAGRVRRDAAGELIGGATCDELERILRGRHQSVSSAVNYAENHGWIRDSGVTRKTSSGSNAIVYEPTDMLVEQMRQHVRIA